MNLENYFRSWTWTMLSVIGFVLLLDFIANNIKLGAAEELRVVVNPRISSIRESSFDKIVYCRLSDIGMSKCVGSPLPLPSKKELAWCPVHPCGPTYIRALPCVDVHPATARCSLRYKNIHDTDGFWKCKPNSNSFKITLPDGCSGDECTNHFVCPCHKVPHTNRQLVFYSDDPILCS